MFESTLCGRYHSFFCLQEICSKAFTAESYNDQERALQRGCRVTMKNGATLTNPLQKWRATAPPESVTPAVTVDEATTQPPATRYAVIMELFLTTFVHAWSEGGVRNMLHPMLILHMYLYSFIYAHHTWAQLGLEPPVVYQDYKKRAPLQ